MMIITLKDIVWVKDQNAVGHLQPIINLAKQQNRLVIATLNYDNCIEVLARKNGIGCDTGIGQWSETGNFQFSDNGFFLLKLHGSIDWVHHEARPTEERPLPHIAIQQASEEQLVSNKYFRPAVVFGQRNKLTAEGPFLDLLRAFREELNRSSLLTVIGYSFVDPHINVFITQWLNANPTHAIRVVNGPDFGKNPNQFVQLLNYLRQKRPAQVEIIPQHAGKGLEQLYSTSKT